MCTVLPFARQRFTPTDLLSWNSIAADRRRRGLWLLVVRTTSKEYDRLTVWLPNLNAPSLRLERDVTGEYSLSYHDGRNWYVFRHGPAILDCLAHMDQSDVRRRNGAAGHTR